MRYTIGVELLKDGNKNTGIFAEDVFHLEFILTETAALRMDFSKIYVAIPVFESPEEAIHYAKSLSEDYNKDLEKSEKIKFFPVKIDSTKFLYKISKKEEIHDKIYHKVIKHKGESLNGAKKIC